MRQTAIFPLCLMMGVVTLPSCKKNQKGADAGQPAAASKPEPASEKVAKAEPAKAEPAKAAEPEKAKDDPAKNCIGALEPTADYLPGTLISLPRPKDYTLSKHFPGYDRGKGKSKLSIVVSDFPMPYKTVAKALSNDSMWSRQEMKLLSNKEIEHKDLKGKCSGTLFEVESTSSDQTVKKFAWIFGNEKRSFQIMASCPAPCKEPDAKVLREAIQTARWNPEREAKRWDRMPFTIDGAPLKPLKGALMTGYRRTFITDGVPDTKGDSEVFQFGSETQPVKDKSVDFAKSTIERVPLKDVQFTKQKKVKALGLDGWEFDATARTRSGAEQWVKYTVLFDKETYWVALGMCPVAKKAKCKPLFKKIMSTVAFVEST